MLLLLLLLLLPRHGGRLLMLRPLNKRLCHRLLLPWLLLLLAHGLHSRLLPWLTLLWQLKRGLCNRLLLGHSACCWHCCCYFCCYCHLLELPRCLEHPPGGSRLLHCTT
jgi:hypothetical protein